MQLYIYIDLDSKLEQTNVDLPEWFCCLVTPNFDFDFAPKDIYL